MLILWNERSIDYGLSVNLLQKLCHVFWSWLFVQYKSSSTFYILYLLFLLAEVVLFFTLDGGNARGRACVECLGFHLHDTCCVGWEHEGDGER